MSEQADDIPPGALEICALSEIPDRGFIVRKVPGLSLVLCQLKGEVFAVENQCSHALATFDGGRLRGARLMCPLHGACFDVRNGQSLGPPASRPIRSFSVEVVDQRVFVLL